MTTGTPWFRRRKWRWPILIGFAVAAGALAITAAVAIHTLVLGGSSSDPAPYATGSVVGVGTFLVVAVVQPWAERRRSGSKRKVDGRER